MESLLIKEQYKATCVLYAEPDYAALLAVDITSREKREYLLNVYEGDWLKRYLRSYHDLRSCPAFQGMFVRDGSLVAVFQNETGVPIDRVFCRGAEVDWRFRLKAAGQLFHLALSVSDFPPEISCAAFLSEQVRIYPAEQRIALRYLVPPTEGMNQRELIFLLVDQIQKVLLHRFESPRAERRFVRVLREGCWTSVPALYGFWVEAEKEIRADYEAVEKKTALGRLLHRTLVAVSEWGRAVFRRKGKG